jgi:hypothetical protein
LIDLKAEFGDRYQIRWDEARKAGGWTKEEYPWLMQIAGRHGFVSLHAEDSLAVVAIGKAKSRDLAKLAGIDLKLPKSQQQPRPGWRLLQFGDWELRCSFPLEELDAVARVIGAAQRRPASERRVLSPEDRAAIGRRLRACRSRMAQTA